MRKNIPLAIVILLSAVLAYAGTTIRNQDLPPSLSISTSFSIGGMTILGRKTNAQIQALSCSGGAGACLASSSDEGDLYISFGSGVGEFRNSRTGKLP